MGKEKIVKPKVYSSKKQGWVDATQSVCSRCGIKGFIAMQGKRKLCFACVKELEDAWKRAVSH